ncbi:MAG TPA: hypothetical protein VFR88_01585 [Microlunatus sp.]|nr:hypothetical protein [Microlunatus sp.]
MSTIGRAEQLELLRHAASRAHLAPSIHNSQPWRFRIDHRTLEIRADHDRRLRVVDPAGRQLMISLGCALFNARVALAADRREVSVHRLPDPADPGLIARLVLSDRIAPWDPLVRLDPAIDRRHSNRREFFETRVTEEVQWELVAAARAEDSELVPVTSDHHRLELARLLWEATAEQSDDPAYRAEIREWTSGIASRKDGMTPPSYPMNSDDRGEIPLRDFGVKVSGHMSPVASGRDQCLMILGSARDAPLAWIRAGEALQRLWLEATRLDHVISLFTQVVEVPDLRDELRTQLGLGCEPQVVIRVGQAAPNVATNRRDLDQLIEEMS